MCILPEVASPDRKVCLVGVIYLNMDSFYNIYVCYYNIPVYWLISVNWLYMIEVVSCNKYDWLNGSLILIVI